MASVEDYTIGCICALSIEAVALRLFLDEEHKCPGIESSHASTQDRNVYTTGAIGGHKIVVATLPLGKYGVSQATGVVGDMIRTFPNLRCCLMVGIGGGAPSSQHDIRLGDVVVSAPVHRSGGILQYDHGKAIQGQPFRITQHLNEPPSILLSAIGKLAQDYEIEENPLQSMVNDVLATKPRLKAKYQRPDDSTDRLYKSAVIHPLDTRGNCEQVCGTEVSDVAVRLTRVAGAGVAEIHYGVIASGSSLMKDAIVRDRLNEEEGVLCFEMEAAGLVNQFPCLVIRGICDYSDSHKNDDWQGYAAMMAAAYTREILRVLLPRKVSLAEKVVDKLSEKLSDIEEGVHILAMCQQDIQDGKMRNQLLDWIPSIDYTGRQNALQREIQEGTGQWFVNTVYFHTWLHQKGGMLFCTGMPGAGKTHIASLVIHYLQSSCSLNPRSLLAYIYCEYTHQLTRETLLGSLLEQLTRLLPTLPPELSTLYKKHEKSRTQPSVKELRTVLHEIVTSSKMCFIVVDGLDECTDDEGMRTFLLETLTALRKSLRASIMTMSRDIQHIRDHFSAQDYLEIKVRATDHDVGVYLDHRIPRVLPLLADDLGLCRTIKAVIMTAAGGMFLLAMLHINSLKGKVNDKAIEDALAEVRSGGSSLISAYDKTMRMIESQDDGYRKLAMHTLSWVAFSSAPLTTEQLQHALAIEPDTTRLDFNNITKLEVILSTCAGLITIQKHRWGDPETIHLVHETTQDYFLETREKYFGSVRTRLACLSLTYLTFHTFESGHCDHNMLASKGVQYPLHGYLVRGFPDFIDGIEEDIRVKTLLKKFLLGDGYVASYMRATGSYSAYPEHLITLRLAISYRLGSCIPEIIRKAGYKRNKLEFWPLHLAVKTGYHEGIQNLLAAPEVDCNATTEEGRSALSYACELGNERSVALLLACDGIACNITDENGRSPLTYALEHGWLSVVQLLLERTDVDYISPDSYGWIPLFYADLGSSEACIKELLGMPNLGDDMVVNKGRTPLIWCIEHRCLQAALLILSREDIKLSAPSQTERGPFIRAVRWGQPKLIAAFLRKSGTNIFAKDSSYRTALDHAAECGNWQVVRELLARYKTKIRIKHRLKGTALFYAIKYASSDILTLVLNQVALDKSWWFVDALYLSIENNRVECFMMLKMKLGVWMRDNPRWLTMCLRHAAEKGDDHTLNTILESAEYNDTGLDEEHVHILSDRTWNDIAIYEALFEIPASQVNARDRLGQTALHAVTRRQDFAATRILLIIGVDKAARDNEGRTAFECASDWPRRLGNLKKKLQPKSSSAAH